MTKEQSVKSRINLVDGLGGSSEKSNMEQFNKLLYL